MIYGGYSKGYKTGNVQNDGTMLPPEFLDSWEIGIKSRFFNNRLQANVSAYYYDYKNFNQWSTAYKCTNYKIYESVGSTYQVGIYTPGADQGPDATIQNVDASTDNGLALLHTCSGVEDPDNPGSYLRVTNDDYDEYLSVAVAPGGAEQKGISGSILFLLTHKDTINLTARWSNNEYNNYNLSSALLARLPLADNVYSDPSNYGDKSGVEFGNSPVRGNVSYTHTEYFGTDTVTFNTTAYYEGKGTDKRVYNSRDGFWYMPGLDDYWMMDASITYDSTRWVPEGMNWQLRLWGTNIFNSQHLYSISYSSSSSYDVRSGTIGGSFVAPRTYGATLSFNF
jgi:outer membrane receptor protein involved in Fe transport